MLLRIFKTKLLILILVITVPNSWAAIYDMIPKVAMQIEEKPFTPNVSGFDNNTFIPEKFAYCVPSEKSHIKSGSDINPALRWFNAPAGTQSLAIIVVDPDVPSIGNQWCSR